MPVLNELPGSDTKRSPIRARLADRIESGWWVRGDPPEGRSLRKKSLCQREPTGCQLQAYWVPDGLQLEKGADLPRALPVGRSVHDALDIVGSETLQLAGRPVGTAKIDPLHVHFRGEH